MLDKPLSKETIVLLLEIDEQDTLTGIYTTDPIRIVLKTKMKTGERIWTLEDLTPANEGPLSQNRLALGRTLVHNQNGYELTHKGITWRIDKAIQGWQAYDEKGEQLPFADPGNYSIPDADVMKRAETFTKERRKGGAVPT